MRVPRVFVEHPIALHGVGSLDADQARQLRSVLRLSLGDEIVVFDGSGVEARAAIASLERSAGTFDIRELSYPMREPPIELTVGISLLRGERFEVAVQKLTELGVTRVVPITADRCVVSFSDARDWVKRADRLRRIMREAAEQSERVTVPALETPEPLAGLLERESRVIALVERSDAVPLHDLPVDTPVTIVIGPEGGWSEAEARILSASRVAAASLGSLILRAETAAIVAAGVIVQRAWSNSWRAVSRSEDV